MHTHWEIGQVEETLHSMFFKNPGKLWMAEEVKRDQTDEMVFSDHRRNPR